MKIVRRFGPWQRMPLAEESCQAGSRTAAANLFRTGGVLPSVMRHHLSGAPAVSGRTESFHTPTDYRVDAAPYPLLILFDGPLYATPEMSALVTLST